MDLLWTPGFLLLAGLLGTCGCSAPENCTNFKVTFERVFSVAGEVAMLNCNLATASLFNITHDPYHIVWHHPATGQELSNRTGQVLVVGTTLWLLNVTWENIGEYVCVLRTPSQCFYQATELVVDHPAKCGRPRLSHQSLTGGVTDKLSCPLRTYMFELDGYNVAYSIRWYKGCELIENRPGRVTYKSMGRLMINSVDGADDGNYTCTLNFTLDGVQGSVSETLNAWVNDDYYRFPQIHKPINDPKKVQIGAVHKESCLVFVPGEGIPFVDIEWLNDEDFIREKPLERVHTSETRCWTEDVPDEGTWFEKLLVFSEVWIEDLNVNYTCRVYSGKGHPLSYFSLQQGDPCLTVPIGSAFAVLTVLFIACVSVYYLFKIDIALWFRESFPALYTNKDLDGKLYDAYIAYPQYTAWGHSQEMETFVFHTLPQVLEKACGYRLFIKDRDTLPGHAVVDSVEENIQNSRRLLLLYTASTFNKRCHKSSLDHQNNNNNNNNVWDSTDNGEDKPSGEMCPDSGQDLECVSAMHRTLMEGSLKVILVEMERIEPGQLEFFPESVLHLRRKQGAVRWWKNQGASPRWRTCLRRADVEKSGHQPVTPQCPSSRFWKEIRYHMPVKGKQEAYPEKTSLLNL